jgi:hypothetical protein
MKPIIQIKEGLLGNLAAILFLLALAAFVVWLDRYSHGEVQIGVWVFAAIFVLCCYFPLDNIRRPRSRTLLIEGDQLVWRIRDKEGEKTREERLLLHQIRRLHFVIPRDTTGSRLPSCAELYFITSQGAKRELPLDFFPGVYRDRIVTAVREHVPDLQVVDVDNTA